MNWLPLITKQFETRLGTLVVSAKFKAKNEQIEDEARKVFNRVLEKISLDNGENP